MNKPTIEKPYPRSNRMYLIYKMFTFPIWLISFIFIKYIPYRSACVDYYFFKINRKIRRSIFNKKTK